MDLKTVGLLSPGDMGHVVGKVMKDHGLEVLTCLSGRSERTRRLAKEGGIGDVPTVEDLVRRADVLLSIVVPSEAPAVAARVARAIQQTKRDLVFVDCNAIAPATARTIGSLVTQAGGRFVDAGIIGGPPRRPGTRFYASGPCAATFAALAGYGLDVRVIGGEIGQASGLKMCYAALTKGTSALTIELLTAARRMGLYDGLMAELALSQGPRLKSMEGLTGVPPKARRWVGEMEEIAATFEAAGLTPRILLGAADVFQFVGATSLADETPESRDEGRSLEAMIAELAAAGA